MGKTIQIKRGPKNTMPTLAQGELGMTTDSGAEGLFIGTGTKNIEMARKSDLTSRKVNGKALSSDITLSASDVGAVPTSRKVNGKALSSDITLAASDVGARPSSWTPSASDVGLGNVGNFKAVSTVASQGLTDTEKSNARANIGAGTSSLTIGTTASTAAAGNHTHTAANVGAVPTSRKVNSKDLSSDITLAASDVGAYSKSETNTLLQNKADTTKKTTVTLSASWTGSASPYTQSVTISGTTVNTKVDLQPDAAAISQMAADGTTALYIVNNNGTLTAYAVGMKPTASMTIQATVSEVSA